MSHMVEVRIAFAAMGTRFALAVRTGPQRAGEARRALEAAARWVRQVELRLSRFDPHSELSRLNAGASGCWQVVSPLLFSALQAAEQARRLTGGLFDPAVLDALTRWGYDRDWRTLQSTRGRPALRAPSPAAAAAHGARQKPSRPQPAGAGGAPFQLDPLVRAVRLGEGVHLDLGGIVKGLTADTVVARLRGRFEAVLADAGGDIAAWSAPGLPPWRVALPASLAGEGGGLVHLRAGGVATSATTVRRFCGPLGPGHHLIDPRTGSPSQSGVEVACVAARSAALAEVLAKAVVVGGFPEARPALERSAPVLAWWRGRASRGKVVHWRCPSGWR